VVEQAAVESADQHGAAQVNDGLTRRFAPRITHTVAASVARIAEEAQAAAVFVYADALSQEQLALPRKFASRVIYVTKTAQQDEQQEEQGREIIRVPDVSLSRFGQIRVAILLALYRKLISLNDVIVCVTGIAGSGSLDTIFVTCVQDEFEHLVDADASHDEGGDVRPEVLERVIEIAAEFGSEGREGKPLGATFVIGDGQHVAPLTKQLVLNPFHGYAQEARNILDPALEETVKEFATIDGAFILQGNGVVESAGTFLKATGQTEFELPSGLGARHQSAAAITSLTHAVAVTVSQSTGTVSIFRKGRIVAELEKPRSQAERQDPQE
jgi:DNA integrity scanning protein DisA with diadenylate cyclase activity